VSEQGREGEGEWSKEWGTPRQREGERREGGWEGCKKGDREKQRKRPGLIRSTGARRKHSIILHAMSRLHRQTARARTCTHTHTHNHTRIHTHTHTHTHAHVPPRETRAHDTHAHRPLGLKQASTSLVPCVPALGEEDRGYETASAVRVRVEGRRRAEGIGSAGREMVRASSIDACMRMHSTHVPTVQGAHAQHLRWQMHGPVEAQGPRTRLVDGQEPCAARCHDVRPCCRPAHPVHPAPAMRSRESGISLRKRVGERGTGGGLRGK